MTHVYADNGEFVVTLTVTDNEGDTGESTTTITVTNVAPTVEAGDEQDADEGDTIRIAPNL